MTISNGGVASDTTVNSGCMTISSGGNACNVTIKAGGMLDGFSWNQDRHWDSIENGSAIVSPNVVIVGNTLKISNGGTANETTVNSGAMNIYSGGVANSTTISSDGQMSISSGGTANETTVINSGAMKIYCGGTANETILNRQCSMYIGNGGTANSTIVVSGQVEIASGGVANDIFLIGGEFPYYERDSFDGWRNECSMYISSGGVANRITVDADGCLLIRQGGIANSATVKSGGWMFVTGTADSVFVASGGILEVNAGGSATIAFNPWGLGTVNSLPGAVVTYLERDAAAYYGCEADGLRGIISKGDVLMVNIGASQRAVVFSGGMTKDTVVNNGGSMLISGGGAAEDTAVYRGGLLEISSGAVASRTLTAGAEASFVVSAGAEATENTVRDTAVLALYGTAASTTVKNMGQFWIYDGGTATSARVGNWGTIYVLAGGSAAEVSIESCGTLHVGRGGSATAVRENGGCIEIADGAHVEFLENTFSGALLTSGETTLHSGTTAVAATIRNAAMTVYEGGVASETVVDGGSLTISSGGRIAGALSLTGGAVVSACKGSIVDFVLATAEAGAPALINDLSLIQGNPDFSITVSHSQAPGVYALAEGAGLFGNTLTVQTTEEDILGILSVGENLIYGDYTYSLDKSNEILSLTVAFEDVTPPRKPVVVASTTAPTNKNVTVSATFSADTATKQYSFDNKTWQAYTSGVVMTANDTVYFRGIDAAGNVSEVTSYTVSNIDKVAPVKPTASADVTAVTNGNVTVSATFSADSAQKQYSLDNKTWKAYTSGVVMTANGTVYFRGIDAAGNVSAVTSYTVSNIDKVAPVKPTASADTASPTNKNVTVSATFSADTATKQYSTDNKTWKAYTSGVTMTANGTVYFRGIDAAGNVSEVTSYTVSNIDKVAPVKPTASADITAVTNGNVTVSATFSADSAQKQYSLDNKTWKAYTSGVTMTANGTLYFRGIDAAGNTSEVTSYTVSNIDKVAPKAPTAKADITAKTNRNVTISATFSADTATKQYSTDNKTWKAYTSGVVMTANGTLYFRGIDAAGNISEVTSYTVSNIDKVAPVKPTASANTASPTNKDVTVTATFSADSAQKQYSTDNKTWMAYTSGVVMTANGTLYFRGIDAAGNISKVTTYKVSNIDKVAPKAPTAKADTTAKTNKNVTVTATFSTDTATKQYSTDNKTWKAYTSGVVMTANGTLYFRGVDAAGNISEVTSYIVSNIDKVAPNTPTGLTVSVSKYNVTATWEKAAAVKDVKVSYEVKVDGQTFTTKSNKYTLKNASVGVHDFAVRTVLSSGTRSAWSSEVVKMVSDVTAPKSGKVTVTQTAADAVKVAWSAATDNVGIARYVVTCGGESREVSGTTLSALFTGIGGKVDATVTAYDAAGNAGKTAKKSVKLADVSAPTQVTGLAAQGTVDNKSGGTLVWKASTDNSGAVAQYLISISGESKVYKSKTNSVKVRKLAAGSHTFTVVAVDKAKNVSPVSAVGGFIVADVIAPKVKKLSAKVTGNTALVTWNATDETGIAKLELSLDDGKAVDITERTSFDFSGLAAGTHVLRFAACDAAGNMAEKTVNCKVKEQKPAPLLAAV